MKKRVITLLCLFALALAWMQPLVPVARAEALLPFEYGFTATERETFESAGGTVEPGESAEGEYAYGEFDQDGDGAAYKVRHITDTSYMSMPNGITLGFPEPLPSDVLYTITAWFYVPSEGNVDVAGKGTLIGPGILINGSAGSNEYKWPNSEATAGRVTYDEWKEVVFETQALGDQIEFLIFRFYTNDFATHPELWYLDNVSVTLSAANAVVDNDVEDLPGLKDVYSDYFMVGTAGGATDLSGKRFDLMKKHFDTWTFGNEMKPDAMQRDEGVFTFDTLDKMITTLKANNFNIIGHTLAWHSQSPTWMWGEKSKAIERLETHIEAVLTHAGSDIVAVDVVNEAFTNNGGPGAWFTNLRNEGWYTALGYEFIEIAFRKAGEVRDAIGRPDIKLYYNDFNDDYSDKAQNMYSMVNDFLDRGVPIDGVGMQAHYNQDTKPANVRETIELFNKLPDGIEVSITELDITIESSRGKDSMTDAEERRQADMYAALFKIFKEYAAGPANPDEGKRLITRVTFWGATDNQSWRSDRHPLLFDKNNKAKDSYYAVLDPDNYIAILDGGLPSDPEAPEPPDTQEPPDAQSPSPDAPETPSTEPSSPAPPEQPSPSPSASPASPAPTPSDDAPGFPWWVIIVGVVVIGGVIALLVARGRKKDG